MPEAITSYVDTSVEPTELIGNTLWRCVPAPRGGRRGYNQKLRHLQEEQISCCSSWHAYAAHWGFSIVESVLQGGREWGETESEEEGAGSSSVLDPPARLPRRRSQRHRLFQSLRHRSFRCHRRQQLRHHRLFIAGASEAEGETCDNFKRSSAEQGYRS